MKIIHYVSIMFRPQKVREVAAEGTEISVVAVNAVNGMLVIGAIGLLMKASFTLPLITALAVLFGPLAGFVVSSIFCRVEWRVGRKLGGEASFAEIYRLFAWAFLPAGFAALLYALLLTALKDASTETELLAALPSLALFCCASRNYCANIISCQKFSRVRGVMSVILSNVIFILIIAIAIGCLSLLFKLGVGEGLKSTFSLFTAL